MKHLARHLVKSGLPLTRPGRDESSEKAMNNGDDFESARLAHGRRAIPAARRTLADIEQAQRPKNINDVSHVPDSWATPPLPVPSAPTKRSLTDEDEELREEEADENREIKLQPGPRRMPRTKRRRGSMSVAVSEEEEDLLRAYAFEKGLSFSEWARGVLFRSMHKKIPSRE